MHYIYTVTQMLKRDKAYLQKKICTETLVANTGRIGYSRYVRSLIENTIFGKECVKEWLSIMRL